MRKRIRQMFWMLSVTGCLAIFQAFVKPDALKSMVAKDGGSKSKGYGLLSQEGEESSHSSLVSSMVDKGLSLAQKGLDTACKSCGIKIYDSHNNNGLNEIRPGIRVLESGGKSGEYPVKDGVYDVEVNHKKYIYRDGKYYRAAASNVYYDKNGNPTLVIDKAQSRYEQWNEEDGHRGNVHRQQVVRSYGNDNGQRPTRPEGMVQSGAPKGLDAYAPHSVKEMVETIHQAKQNLKERNRILEQLAEQDRAAASRKVR